VREGDWKLISRVITAADTNLTAADKQWFLANLASDPGERTNVVKAHPEVFERLRMLHRDWFQASRGTAEPDDKTQDKKGNEE
jgi:hypothetical protein